MRFFTSCFFRESVSPKPLSIPLWPFQWHRWQIYRRCCWYRWQLATGVIDTGGKFATGVVVTAGATWLANISEKFSLKIWNDPNFIFRDLEEDDLWKNLKQQISWHYPFKWMWGICVYPYPHFPTWFSWGVQAFIFLNGITLMCVFTSKAFLFPLPQLT